MLKFEAEGRVQDEWLDFNGHMNVGFYGVAADKISDHYFDYLEIGEAYRARTNNSFFTVESHFTYQAELLKDEAYTAHCGLLDFDAKRLHFYTAMYKLDGTLAATAEWMHLHMDMNERVVAAMPEDSLAFLTTVQAFEGKTPVHADIRRVIGNTIGIKRKT